MKIHINLLTLLLVCVSITSIFAQDRSEHFYTNAVESIAPASEDIQYRNEAIYLKTRFWKGQMYVKNGVEYRVGFWGNKIKKEFEAFPAAKEEFKKYQKQLKTSTLLGLGGCLMTFAAIISYSNRASKSPNNYVLVSDAESAMYFGGLGTALVAGTWGTLSSNNSLQRAIFLRNQALCEGK